MLPHMRPLNRSTIFPPAITLYGISISSNLSQLRGIYFIVGNKTFPPIYRTNKRRPTHARHTSEKLSKKKKVGKCIVAHIAQNHIGRKKIIAAI